MGDRVERACRVCSSLLHHEDDCEAAETPEERLSRLRAMSNDDGTTWDLSPYDQAAIAAVLVEMDALRNQRDAARLQADEWKRYAEALDAGVGSTMEEQRDEARREAAEYATNCAAYLISLNEARTLVRRLTWALGWCDYASGVYAQRGVSETSDAAVKDGEQAYDDAVAAIRRWDETDGKAE